MLCVIAKTERFNPTEHLIMRQSSNSHPRRDADALADLMVVQDDMRLPLHSRLEQALPAAAKVPGTPALLNCHNYGLIIMGLSIYKN